MPDTTNIILGEVLDERRRRVEAEGFTAAHDDAYVDGELAKAAATYALGAALDQAVRAEMDKFGTSWTPQWLKRLWPWETRWWKPKSRRSDLIRAAALIVAEIERLDRMGGGNG